MWGGAAGIATAAPSGIQAVKDNRPLRERSYQAKMRQDVYIRIIDIPLLAPISIPTLHRDFHRLPLPPFHHQGLPIPILQYYRYPSHLRRPLPSSCSFRWPLHRKHCKWHPCLLPRCSIIPFSYMPRVLQRSSSFSVESVLWFCAGGRTSSRTVSVCSCRLQSVVIRKLSSSLSDSKISPHKFAMKVIHRLTPVELLLQMDSPLYTGCYVPLSNLSHGIDPFCR